MNFKHIVWDFDGTLFDTYPHIARAFQTMLKKEYLVQENVFEIETQMRISMQNAYDYYKEKFEIDDVFIKKFNEYRTLQENANALPYNSVHQLCMSVYQQGRFNYLHTHRDKTVHSMMQRHGFIELFTEIVTEENGFPRKPSPDGLNYLIEKYKMDRSEVLSVGDRKIDLDAAKAAGVKFCLFKENAKQVSEGEPDFTVQNFGDLHYIIFS